MTNLNVVEIPKRGPGAAHALCEKIIEEQRDRDGEMAAIALVVVHPDGSIGHAYVSEDHFFPLLGALRDLEHRMLRDANP